MIPFTMSGIACDFPQNYGELNFQQFFDLRKNPVTDLEVIAILSGIPKREWELCENVNIDFFVKEYLEFLKDKADFDLFFLPDFITISGKQYPRPKEINLQTYGQKIALVSAIQEAEEKGGTEIDVYPFALALYMQPTITGTPFDMDAVDKLVPEIMKCKIAEAWPLCSFFLSNCEKSLKENQQHLVISQAQKNFRQELKSLQNSESFQQFSLWRKLSIQLLTKFCSWTMPRFTLPFLMKLRLTVTKKD